MAKNLNGARVEVARLCDGIWNCQPCPHHARMNCFVGKLFPADCVIPDWTEPEKPAPGAVVVVTVSPEEWEAKAARIRELEGQQDKLLGKLQKLEAERIRGRGEGLGGREIKVKIYEYAGHKKRFSFDVTLGGIKFGGHCYTTRRACVRGLWRWARRAALDLSQWGLSYEAASEIRRAIRESRQNRRAA